MPNDALTLYHLVNEINSQLKDGKIDKVNMPENDEITLTIRARGKNNLLVISCNPTLPRCHLTFVKKPNDLTAPSFLMILRKYLLGGVVENISLFNNDRIIAFKINKRNDLKDTKSYFLICELLGRFSNIILAEEDFTILDVIKKVFIETNGERPLLPKYKYAFPTKNKVDFCDIDNINDNYSSIEDILSNISGLSKESAKEILFVAQKDNLSIDKVFDSFLKNEISPCLSIKNNSFADYFFRPYQSLDLDFKPFDTLSEAIDMLFSEKDTTLRKSNKTKDIAQAIKKHNKKLLRRLDDNQKRIDDAKLKENYKIMGELITCNIYKLKKGDKVLECLNYYTNENISIPLDESLYPAENSNAYFKKYTKLRNGEGFALKDIERINGELYYLNSIEQTLNNCSDEQEFIEIREELSALGVIKKTYKQKKAKTRSLPVKLTIDGFEVFVGKNNTQNNEVTFNIASSIDIWLHTKSYHGSHGVIIANGKDVPDSVLEKAAKVVAYYSSARDLEKVEVDYTFRKNVKKGESLGLVHYQNYKSIYVSPTQPEKI